MTLSDAERNKALVRDSIKRVWRDRRLEDLGELLAADFVDHGALPGTPPGPAGFAAGVQQLLATFPDAVNRVDDMIAEADRVVTHWTMTGTHQPTGKPIRLSGVTIARIDGGKIAEHWSYRDDLALLRQLGAMR